MENMKHLNLDLPDNMALRKPIVLALFEESKTAKGEFLSKHAVEVVAGYISMPVLQETFESLGWRPERVRLTPFGREMARQINSRPSWANHEGQRKCIDYLLSPKEPWKSEGRCLAFYMMRRALVEAGRVQPLIEAIAAELVAHNRHEYKYPFNATYYDDSLEVM